MIPSLTPGLISSYWGLTNSITRGEFRLVFFIIIFFFELHFSLPLSLSLSFVYSLLCLLSLMYMFFCVSHLFVLIFFIYLFIWLMRRCVCLRPAFFYASDHRFLLGDRPVISLCVFLLPWFSFFFSFGSYIFSFSFGSRIFFSLHHHYHHLFCSHFFVIYFDVHFSLTSRCL